MAKTGFSYHLERAVFVGAGLQETFEFLSDPRTLPQLDPPALKVQLLNWSPGPVRAGSEAEYIFRWSGIPVYLRIVITDYQPYDRIVIEQVQGPWQSYRYVCMLRAVLSGTEVSERAEVRARPGLFERALHMSLVKRQTWEILVFRQKRMKRLLSERQRIATYG